MDSGDYEKLARSLLAANSAADVKAIVEAPSHKKFFGSANWRNYGGEDKNWDRAGSQQNNAIGALTELITNAQDAVLTRKVRESGVGDLRSRQAPQTMFDAVKLFFPQAIEGRLHSLSPTELTKLAEQTIVVGVKRVDKRQTTCPNYTIVDFGEGQHPKDFPDTFLSLSKSNKEGIPFVQGKFNMGSTGCLRFCTRSDHALGRYKLIISRHYGGGSWGWTLIRIRSPRDQEELPVVEYFAPAGEIPEFETDYIDPFPLPDFGRLTNGGTIVKLYEYDVGGRAHDIGLGLDRALTFSLMDCALPVRLYDFDAAITEDRGGMRAQGLDARTFAGLGMKLRADLGESTTEDSEIAEKKPAQPTTEFVRQIAEVKSHPELGRIRVVAIGVSEMQQWLRDQPDRLLYTLNGQVHARKRASFLNTSKVSLGDLRNHLIVNVICDDMSKPARFEIFMSDRERMVDNRLSRELDDLIVDALKNDPKLRQYAAVIRHRRASDHIENEKEQKDMLSELLRVEPAIKELFGLGNFFKDLGKKPGVSKLYVGKKFPTFLEPLNLRQESEKLFVKEVPINAHRQIKCGTDAVNDYLSRAASAGWTLCSSDVLPHTVSLYNGTATFTVEPPIGANIGDELEIEFGFQDHGTNSFRPLTYRVKLLIVAPEEKQKSPPGEKKKTEIDEKEQKGMPSFVWITESEWNDHQFNKDSGAYVSQSEGKVVYLNRDNQYLRAIKAAEKDTAARDLAEHRFKWGMGLLTLSIYKRACFKGDSNAEDSEENAEQLTRTSSEAIAPYIVPLVKWLSRDDL